MKPTKSTTPHDDTFSNKTKTSGSEKHKLQWSSEKSINLQTEILNLPPKHHPGFLEQTQEVEHPSEE